MICWCVKICLGNICFKCLDISAFQTLFYQMHISGYVCKCLSLQGNPPLLVYCSTVDFKRAIIHSLVLSELQEILISSYLHSPLKETLHLVKGPP